MLFLLFALFFAGGPILYRVMIEGEATARRIRALGLLMVVAIWSALALRYLVPPGTFEAFHLTIAIILIIWLAWVAGLAMGTLALRRIDPSARMRRWTRIIGTLSTTVPWFGLAAADLVGL